MKKTKQQDLDSILKKLSSKEQHWIQQGTLKYEFLKSKLVEAITNNPFGDHYFIYSEPGFSKTYTTQEICREYKIKPLTVSGNAGVFAFAANLAYVLENTPGKDKIRVVFDDCDSFFEKQNINVIKGMFDKSRNVLGWNKALTPAILATLDEEMAEALQEYRVIGRSGFEIPTDRFTFITLTNKPLASSVDIDNATESKKQIKKDENAVRRRVEYEDLSMDTNVAWGYCANVLLNQPLIEKYLPKVTLEEKLEMLNWTSPANKWSRITDRNLSLFEKMAKDKIKYPDNYLDKWASSYLILI
jgi:hypothetical protein